MSPFSFFLVLCGGVLESSRHHDGFSRFARERASSAEWPENKIGIRKEVKPVFGGPKALFDFSGAIYRNQARSLRLRATHQAKHTIGLKLQAEWLWAIA